MLLIGLDAASKPENFGFAVGVLAQGHIDLESFGLLRTRQLEDALATVVAPRLLCAKQALIAIDAPLGWPRALGVALAGHKAGDPISAEKTRLFSRETDHVVATRVGQTPLEVGADKIARAAHTAVAVLAQLRKLVDRPIPLAWRRTFEGLAAIEVYPAATLKARGLDHSGYKKTRAGDQDVRRRIAQNLRDEMPALECLIDKRADIFDAALCLLCAKDFLSCNTLLPVNEAVARQEGWIWVRAPDR